MNSINQKWMQVGLVLLAIGVLVGCGSSKTSNGDGFGSTSTASTATDPTTAMAVCSQDVSGSQDFQVRLMQYVDPYGQTRSDYVRLQFKIAPAAWQSSNLDMLVYRWTAAPDNSTSIDSTPLAYQFEKKVPAGFQLLSSQAYQIFNWNEIVQFGQATGVSANSPQDFFNTATLLVNLKDMTNSFQVLRVVLRMADKTIVYSTDVLIPTYQADPVRYQQDPRHPTLLQSLHPLKDKVGQSWTQNNYFEFARGFCF